VGLLTELHNKIGIQAVKTVAMRSVAFLLSSLAWHCNNKVTRHCPLKQILKGHSSLDSSVRKFKYCVIGNQHYSKGGQWLMEPKMELSKCTRNSPQWSAHPTWPLAWFTSDPCLDSLSEEADRSSFIITYNAKSLILSVFSCYIRSAHTCHCVAKVMTVTPCEIQLYTRHTREIGVLFEW